MLSRGSAALAPQGTRAPALKWSGPDTSAAILVSQGAEGSLLQTCHQESREGGPRAAGNSSQTAKKSFALK